MEGTLFRKADKSMVTVMSERRSTRLVLNIIMDFRRLVLKKRGGRHKILAFDKGIYAIGIPDS